MKTVFKVSLATGIVGLMLVGNSCHDQQTEDALQYKIDSLRSLVQVKDESMVLLAQTMGDIQNNLNAIKEKEHIITTNVQGGEGTKEQIQSDIEAIYGLLQANQKKVRDLEAKLKNATKKNSEFEAIINVLQDQIAQQNAEIDRLNNLLKDKDVEIAFLDKAVIKLSGSVDSLSTESAHKDVVIETMNDEANVAYYIIGSRKELRKNGVTERSGLGGRKAAGDVDNSLFTKIDIREAKEIPTHCKDVKIISTHPSGCFDAQKDESGLVTIKITKPNKFWSQTRHLIIQGSVVDGED